MQPNLKGLEKSLISKGEVLVDDLNLLEEPGIYCIGNTPPANSCKNCTWSQLIVISNTFSQQIILKPSGQYIAIREKVGNPPKWGRWCKITGNFELEE